MKTIKRIAHILLASVVLYSCTDAIDIREPGIQDDIAVFENVEDLQNGLLGVYIQMDHTQDIFLNANYGDEVTRGIANGGQGLDGFNFFLVSTNAEARVFWAKYYTVNMIANRVLAAAEGIEPESGEEATYDNILGSLRAIRAYCHFMLFAYYTPDYTNPSGVSIPIVDFVPSVEHRPSRDNVSDVIDYIKADLTAAEALLSEQSDKYFISRDFCNALRARLAAYTQDYTTAGTLAQNLLGVYPISNATQFASMFGDSNHDDSEVIFQLNRTVNDRYDRQSATGGNGSVVSGGRAGNVFAFTNIGPNGGAFFQMNRALYNSFDSDDVRVDVYLHPGSTINPAWDNEADPNADRLVINKYPGKDGTPLMADLKIFRSAEMLFIAAEAHIANNELGQAASLIQQLRNNRIAGGAPLPSYANQQEAYGDLLDERRKELAFEGHRYLDLKRLGTRGGRGIDRALNECNFYGWATCTLGTDDYRFTLPIPQAEFNANPNMTQNPGYSE